MTTSSAHSLYTYAYHKGVTNQAALLLHGVGGDEHGMDQIGKLLVPDAHWISPKGKVTVDGHARYFTRRDDSSFDPREVTAETNDMATFITQAQAEHAIADDPLVAIGYSNGANLIASLLAKKPRLITKAILFRGMLPVDFTESPDLQDIDVLLLNGQDDHIMNPTRVNQLATYLTAHGASVTLQWVAAGHQLSPEDISIAAQWLAR